MIDLTPIFVAFLFNEREPPRSSHVSTKCARALNTESSFHHSLPYVPTTVPAILLSMSLVIDLART